jgi:hypothetical protein
MSSRIHFIFILIISFNVNAQSIIEKVDFNANYSKNYDIKEFSCTQVESVAYFKFIISENRDDTKYILESSENGIVFFLEKEKEGFKSPNGTPLMYCFSVDTKNNLDTRFFRIKIMNGENYDYSPTIKLLENRLTQNNTLLSTQNNWN